MDELFKIILLHIQCVRQDALPKLMEHVVEVMQANYASGGDPVGDAVEFAIDNLDEEYPGIEIAVYMWKQLKKERLMHAASAQHNYTKLKAIKCAYEMAECLKQRFGAAMSVKFRGDQQISPNDAMDVLAGCREEITLQFSKLHCEHVVEN
jgi:hypothetical protein